MTDSIQRTWGEVLAEPVLFGEPSELERLWNLAQLRQTSHGLREVSLERCMLLEGLLDGLRCVLV